MERRFIILQINRKKSIYVPLIKLAQCAVAFLYASTIIVVYKQTFKIMNKVQAIISRILKSDNFENVAHVCCDWEEFVFEVAEWGVDHIATVDFDTLTASEVEALDSFIASFGCSPSDPHPCSKYATPVYA